MWSAEAAQEVLEAAGIEVLSVEPINFGTQIRCRGGISVSVFSTGKLLCQGKETARIKTLFETTSPPSWIPKAEQPVRSKAPATAESGEPASSGVPVRIVTDYPSTRPEDAGIPPPWLPGVL